MIPFRTSRIFHTKATAHEQMTRDPVAGVVATRRRNIRDESMWVPIPALIAIGLALILSGHLIPGLNPRLGNMAQIPALQGPSQLDSTIWLSVFPMNDHIYVTTADRRSFTYPVGGNSLELEELTQYLHRRTRNLALSSNLAMELSPYHAVVNLAVDKRIAYGDFRPIIYALATAKISNYSFETLSIDR